MWYIVKEIHDEVNSQGYITTLVLTFDKSKFYDKALAAYDGINGVNTDSADGTVTSVSEKKPEDKPTFDSDSNSNFTVDSWFRRDALLPNLSFSSDRLHS